MLLKLAKINSLLLFCFNTIGNTVNYWSSSYNLHHHTIHSPFTTKLTSNAIYLNESGVMVLMHDYNHLCHPYQIICYCSPIQIVDYANAKTHTEHRLIRLEHIQVSLEDADPFLREIAPTNYETIDDVWFPIYALTSEVLPHPTQGLVNTKRKHHCNPSFSHGIGMSSTSRSLSWRTTNLNSTHPYIDTIPESESTSNNVQAQIDESDSSMALTE